MPFCEGEERLTFKTQSLLLKLKDVHVNRAGVKWFGFCCCFLLLLFALWDNSMAIEHVAINLLSTFFVYFTYTANTRGWV